MNLSIVEQGEYGLFATMSFTRKPKTWSMGAGISARRCALAGWTRW